MNYKIVAPKIISHQVVALPASKSISNRALILDALTNFKSKLSNLSKANDTLLLQRMLKEKSGVLNAEDAGTVLRFAAVYFSLINGDHIITGTERLMNRPMQPLIDALKRLSHRDPFGSGNAEYKNVNGKKVLVIQGGKLEGGEVTIDGSESSQFVSALLLCGAAMPFGLKLTLKGKVVSEPYIDMTLGLLEHVGINYRQTKSKIEIPYQPVKPFKIKIENDWSSAAFLYSFVALGKVGTALSLKDLKLDSLQGDAVIAQLMETFGVKSKQVDADVLIRKVRTTLPKQITIDATDFPDLVPTLSATALALGVKIKFKGIAHLRVKESDRVDALVETAKKFGAKATATKSTFTIIPPTRLNENVFVNTYNDHRMAMAFAPLSLRCKDLVIENVDVVKKSFLNYWSVLKKVGFKLVES